MKIISNSTQNRQKTRKAQKDKNTSFPKESVENADLYKPALRKTMTTHELCVKYNFVSPLKLYHYRCSFLYQMIWKTF